MPHENDCTHAFDYDALMKRVHSLADTYSFVTLSYSQKVPI